MYYEVPQCSKVMLVEHLHQQHASLVMKAAAERQVQLCNLTGELVKVTHRPREARGALAPPRRPQSVVHHKPLWLGGVLLGGRARRHSLALVVLRGTNLAGVADSLLLRRAAATQLLCSLASCSAVSPRSSHAFQPRLASLKPNLETLRWSPLPLFQYLGSGNVARVMSPCCANRATRAGAEVFLSTPSTPRSIRRARTWFSGPDVSARERFRLGGEPAAVSSGDTPRCGRAPAAGATCPHPSSSSADMLDPALGPQRVLAQNPWATGRSRVSLVFGRI